VGDADFQHLRQMTHLNPEVEKYRMGTRRQIEWLSLDGKRLRGALLLPASYEAGKQYPLIVEVYGGQLQSKSLRTFSDWGSSELNLQLLATRGYAVLLPDAPLDKGTPMLDHVKTILPGVNKVIEVGIADPQRLGVMGHSYGGYGVLSLTVQTKRFKAAVSSAGFGDLIAFYGEMSKDGVAYGAGVIEQRQGQLGGTPWQYRERYIENSPVSYLDRVETPLLILHGSDDTVVAPFLSDEVFVGLRRLGKEVEYANYEAEGHVVLGHTNFMDYCQRIIDWFDNHLKKPEDQAAEKPKPN
jgi:dipeptidyl aminopeptidase/acylaminoacyl peptidase